MAETGDNPDAAPSDRDALNRRYAPYVVSPLLTAQLERGEGARVIIDISLDYPSGPRAARKRVEELVKAVAGTLSGRFSRQHVFATLSQAQISELLAMDRKEGAPAVYKIWRDTPLQAHLDRSVKLVKAEACVRAFDADGRGITWAVIDSGIDGDHPHFKTYETLGLDPKQASTPQQAQMIDRVEHRDFTDGAGEPAPLTDAFGHGTHVAGIIAGATLCVAALGGQPVPADPGAVRIARRRDDSGRVRLYAERLDHGVSGVAPRCKLVSLKVLDATGAGDESALLAALDYVDMLNADGQRMRIHGVNISIGYPFEAEWFAAGQSPVCVAVNRLVDHGVVVVVSAGNDGSVMLRPDGSAALKRIGLDQSISDPGNAEKAITVGSTHPEFPHTYGVSYFSSRGPTADGRRKPDLVAPGERIISCASDQTVQNATGDDHLDQPFTPIKGVAYYREESGTSMAAPHVSGACAGFLSIHREYIGQPAEVKAALMDSATDLKRKADFQGAGLLDVLRAIQSR